jgi:hypothetical protein
MKTRIGVGLVLALLASLAVAGMAAAEGPCNRNWDGSCDWGYQPGYRLGFETGYGEPAYLMPTYGIPNGGNRFDGFDRKGKDCCFDGYRQPQKDRCCDDYSFKQCWCTCTTYEFKKPCCDPCNDYEWTNHWSWDNSWGGYGKNQCGCEKYEYQQQCSWSCCECRFGGDNFYKAPDNTPRYDQGQQYPPTTGRG